MECVLSSEDALRQCILRFGKMFDTAITSIEVHLTANLVEAVEKLNQAMQEGSGGETGGIY